MKFNKGSIFINTSRGEIIDEEGLINSLEKGLIYSAGLDVLSNETDKNFIKNNLILQYAKTNNKVMMLEYLQKKLLLRRF